MNIFVSSSSYNFSLIPSSKKDWEAVSNLQNASPEQIIALASELLPWLKDANWPIADSIQELLLPHVNYIRPIS